VRTFRLWSLILILFAGQAMVNVRLRNLEPAWVEPAGEQKQKWDPNLYRTLSFGHLPTAIDALWLRVVTDPSLAHVVPGEHARIFYDLDLASDLDPSYFELYHWGAYLLSIVRNDNSGARDLLVKGLAQFRSGNLSEEFKKRFWPNAFSLYLTLAYVYLYELSDMPNASAIFREAAEIPGAPRYLVSLKQRLEQPDGDLDVALRLIDFLIAEQKERVAKETLQAKRQSLVVSYWVRTLNRRFTEWRKKEGFRSKLSDRALWTKFKVQEKIPNADPWGGLIDLRPDGRIDTTTSRPKVFGLE